jgi:hypothetical protein
MHFMISLWRTRVFAREDGDPALSRDDEEDDS